MMLSAITGLGSANFVSNITEASFKNKVGAVDSDVTKQPSLISDYDSFSLSNEFMQLMNSDNNDESLSLLGSNKKESAKAGFSYGAEANDLRKKGMILNLAGAGQSQQNTNLGAAESVANQIFAASDTQAQNNQNNPAPSATVTQNSQNQQTATVEEQNSETEEEAPQEAQSSSEKEITEDEQKQIQELKSRDAEVRTHEQAHLAASGGYATSGASFSYQRGPDGKNYAIGGEVSIDTSAGSTPEETIRKMAVVQKAALAPAQPSGQDRAVAAAAAQAKMQAQQELTAQRSENTDAESTEETPDAKQNNEVSEAQGNEESKTSSSGLTSPEEMRALANGEDSDAATQAINQEINAAANPNSSPRAALTYTYRTVMNAYGIAG